MYFNKYYKPNMNICKIGQVIQVCVCVKLGVFSGISTFYSNWSNLDTM